MCRWSLRRRRWPPNTIFCIFMFNIILLTTQINGESENDVNTNESVTGKLNQFRGFYTPRPHPVHKEFTYSSIWASWSAWSFCVNGVQIRVRACNTVRGFSCPGSNRETKPCEFNEIVPPLTPQQRRKIAVATDRDYEAIDPWEEDRREALRQLYSDYDSNNGNLKKKNQPVQQSGGRTRSGLGPSQTRHNDGVVGPPGLGPSQTRNNDGVVGSPGTIRQPGNSIEELGKMPSITPDLLFASKIESVKQPVNTTIDFKQFGDNSTRENGASTPSSVSPHVFNDTTQTSTQNVLLIQRIDNDNEIVLLASPSNNVSSSTSTRPPPAVLRTTMSEVSSTVANVERSKNVNDQQNVLHSGETVFSRDERISLETAKAFEWMLANMSQAADAELLLSQETRRNNGLHSGESMHQANVKKIGEADDTRKRVFGIKSYSSQLKNTEGNGNINLKSFSSTKPSSVKNDVEIRPTSSLLEEVPPEELEHDLLKIQSVMRQIEGELEALKIAEEAATLSSKKPTAPNVYNGIGRLNVVKLHSGDSMLPRKNLNVEPVIESTETPLSLARTLQTYAPLPLNNFYKSIEAEWTDWRPWTECFCGRQIRTRSCKYDSFHSKGCVGKSYEVRPCNSAPNSCPNERTHDQLSSSLSLAITPTPSTGFYTLATRKPGDRYQDGFAFKQNPLLIATPIN